MQRTPVPRRPPSLAVALIALLCTACTARALTWEAAERPVTLYTGVSEAVVEFAYRNDTAAPVKIVGVKSECTCSVPDLPEEPVPSGAKGVLKVRYHPGATPGTRDVRLEVTTDEPGVPPALLTLRATLTPSLTLSPVLLRWTRGDQPAPRQVRITAAPGVPLSGLRLLPPPDTLSATLAPAKERGVWLLTLAPASTADVLTTHVKLAAEIEGVPVVHSVYAIVR